MSLKNPACGCELSGQACALRSLASQEGQFSWSWAIKDWRLGAIGRQRNRRLAQEGPTLRKKSKDRLFEYRFR